VKFANLLRDGSRLTDKELTEGEKEEPFNGVGKDFANYNKVGLTFVRGLER
jgi:hypothetical protein